MTLITENDAERNQEENNDDTENDESDESDEDNNDFDEDDDIQLSLTPTEYQCAQSLKPLLPTDRPLSLKTIESFCCRITSYLKDEFNLTVDPLVLKETLKVEFSIFNFFFSQWNNANKFS